MDRADAGGVRAHLDAVADHPLLERHACAPRCLKTASHWSGLPATMHVFVLLTMISRTHDAPAPSAAIAPSTASRGAWTTYPDQKEATGADLLTPHAARRPSNETASCDVHTGDDVSRAIIWSDLREFASEKAKSAATSPMLSPNAAAG